MQAHLDNNSVPDPEGIPSYYYNSSHLVDHEGWLQGGWLVVESIELVLGDLAGIPSLSRAADHRALLKVLARRLHKIDWRSLPYYWANVGQGLAKHWEKILESKAALSWEKLQIELELTTPRLSKEDYSFWMVIKNLSGVTAHNLLLHIDENPKLTWKDSEVHLK
jgi:hypothetical protein